jgi:hypothetical protein
VSRPSLSRTAPVAVLLSGCALLGAGLAGVARVDAPLTAAATPPPAAEREVDVTWHHRDGDCVPRDQRHRRT